MVHKWIGLLLVVLIIMLTACNAPVYNQAEMNVADVKLRAQNARLRSDISAKTVPALLVNRGSYVDTTPRSLYHDPAWLNNHIVIRGDQLPFSYYSRTIAIGGGNDILTKYQTGLQPAVNVSMSYSGTLRGALNLLAAKTGYVYSVEGKSINWQAFVTRTFDIAFMPGNTDYLMGKASGGGTTTQQGGSAGGGGGGTNTQVINYTTSDSSDDEFSNLKGTLSLWKDLDATISQMLSPEGKVMVSQSTTSVTVRDRPSNVRLVAQYIRNLNENLAKQVLVKVQVLEIALQNDYNFGIDWQIVANAFHSSPFVINGSFGTPVSITAFQPQSGITALGTAAPVVPQFGFTLNPNATDKIPSYTILLNALSQQGKTSIVSEPRVVCLNNQVSVVRIVNSEGYLASVENTALASTGPGSTNVGVGTVTSQLTPGTVITGLTLYILPKILGNRIFLQVNADLSTRNAFTDVFSGSGTTGTKIQVPNVTEKHFNQRSVIRSGDTLILSGFRQVSNTANAAQFLNSQALGGRGALENNKETIVLITPIILPGSA